MYDYLEYVSAEGTELKEIIKTYLDEDEAARVLHGMAYAIEKHGPDKRKDGRIFYQHPFTVAYYLAEYRLDANTLIAAILHDVAEDVEKVTIEDIEQTFGKDVAKLVNAVTKIEIDSAEKTPLTRKTQSLATFHKLFAAMVNDVRVILIKLFDRLHNMRTIAPMRPESQLRSATESLEVYAPLAHRLGMWHIKTELETLSLEVVDPDALCDLRKRLVLANKQQQLNHTIIKQLTHALNEANVEIAEIVPSPRNPYPIYKRAKQTNGQSIVDNAPRIVVVVNDIAACYDALGIIHKLWKPRPGKFDDFIAAPRVNMYRALHTNVITNDGQVIKFRLRSTAMKSISEIGVLAKWQQQNVALDAVDPLVEELFESISNHVQDEAADVYNGVLDVLSEQIVVISPEGDSYLLPLGSTPLDYAYRLHTELGHEAYKAAVNGVPVSLNYVLKDGDQVEISQRPSNPQRGWLNEDLGYLQTYSAMRKVRRYFKGIDPVVLKADGELLLAEELQMAGLRTHSAESVAKFFGYATKAELFLQIGLGNLLTSEVSARLVALEWIDSDAKEIGRTVKAEDDSLYIIHNADLLGQLSLCTNCNPRPGDEIYGYIRNSTDITVHRIDCSDLPRKEGDRTTFLSLDWGQTRTLGQSVQMLVDVFDRTGMLLDITKVLQPEQINIDDFGQEQIDNGMQIKLRLVVHNSQQLVRVMHKIRALVNVREVRCFLPSGGNDRTHSSVSTGRS